MNLSSMKEIFYKCLSLEKKILTMIKILVLASIKITRTLQRQTRLIAFYVFIREQEKKKSQQQQQRAHEKFCLAKDK